ncbi:DUF4190 domain-containing protein [Actinoplanes sp. NPDC026623]|uniref:DUF4190 domain-containing protein n=1 Tax=Actinoplanes sp. NPDC026623 TaxID=3155610 RepID=UPI0033D00630
MTYPPTPGPDGSYPPPPDPPVQAYQPPPGYEQQPYAYGQPAYGTPAQPPGYGPPTGYDYGNPGSPYSYQGGPYLGPPPTEGLAIASMVVSCVAVPGLCMWGVGGLLGLLGAILGHVARRRIRASGAGGDGLALAGIIVGWVMAGLSLIGVTLLAIALASDYQS